MGAEGVFTRFYAFFTQGHIIIIEGYISNFSKITFKGIYGIMSTSGLRIRILGISELGIYSLELPHFSHEGALFSRKGTL